MVVLNCIKECIVLPGVFLKVISGQQLLGKYDERMTYDQAIPTQQFVLCKLLMSL